LISIIILSCVVLLKAQSNDDYDYEDYYDGEGGSGDEFEYYDDVEYDEYNGRNAEDYDDYSDDSETSGDFYEYETKYQDAELEFIPEMVSSPLTVTLPPGHRVSFPCEARDADQFVRVWMRGHTMLYTGTIRHEEDPRLELAGEDGSSLVITDLTEEDSGQYECRIMVEKPVVVTHSLTVANIFAIHTEPAEAVVSVPLRGHTRLGCSTTGGQADIEWTRDGGKFSNNDSYNYQGDFLELADVTTQDAGYYYCTAVSPEGERKTASIQVKVLFPAEILSAEKHTLQSGRGFETELTCVVAGEPKPRVMWYKDGSILNITSSSRTEYQVAGSKHILVIHNTQGSDFGTYMCYASNAIGATQKMIEIKAEDRNDKELKYRDHSDADESKGQSKKLDNSTLQAFKDLKKQLGRHRRVVATFKQKIEKEINSIKDQLKVKRKSSGGSGSSGGAISSSLSDDFYDEVDRLEELYLNLKSSFNGFDVKLTMIDRNSQDETLKIWDNLHDLQELSNVTSKNLEEIYDKEIINLIHFQSVAQEELKRIKTELGNVQNGAVSYDRDSNDHGFEEKFYQLQDALQMIRNSNKVNQNLFQNFRSDLNRAYVDIDDLKKFRQQVIVDNQMFTRFMARVEVDVLEEIIIKVGEIESQIQIMERTLSKTSQRMRKITRNSGDNEKVDVLLKEIQNMKTQMFFLQQSILQMRTQEHLALEVGDGEVGPAYNSELETDVARLKTEVEMLTGRFVTLESQRLDEATINRNEFDIRNNALLERIDDVEEKTDNARIVADACGAASDSVRRDITHLTNMLQDQETAEKERVKYLLRISGLRKKKRLERPLHLLKTVNSFINETLRIENVEVEEAERFQDGKKKPLPIRVKCSSLKEKNLILKAGRKLKGKVRISEEFTEKDRNARKHLAEFAQKQSKTIKSRWALQQDKLFFNGNMYAFNHVNETVVKVGKIE